MRQVGSIDDGPSEDEAVRTQETEEDGAESSTDPEAWRIETTRVATKLKIHPSSEDTSHWRQDLDQVGHPFQILDILFTMSFARAQQAEECLREMSDIWEKTEKQMTAMGSDISRQLERVREKEGRMQRRHGPRLSSHAEKSKRIEEIQVRMSFLCTLSLRMQCNADLHRRDRDRKGQCRRAVERDRDGAPADRKACRGEEQQVRILCSSASALHSCVLAWAMPLPLSN